jgi:D-hydroxyproline dehydrogenase subunit alpha
VNKRVPFTFDDRQLEGRMGESLAAALIAAGVKQLRRTHTGEPRGVFCGMGVCQDCLVEVDGKPNQRACMTKLEKPLTARTETFGRALAPVAVGEPPRLIDDIPEEAIDILVIGAGPAGLAAAIEAQNAGAKVVVVDERPAPGGQYFKQVLVNGTDLPRADAQHQEGARLIEAAREAGVEVRNGFDVWGAFSPHELIGTVGGIVRRFNPQRLIVATGAYERGVPVPGWTLPGVMTTGAAQTLWRSYRRLPGERVLIAGNGPLNMQVASELARGGVELAAVVELASVPAAQSLRLLARMALASPKLVMDGLRYRARLRDVPFVYGSAVSRIERSEKGLVAHVSRYPASPPAQVQCFEVDAVCLGYGFQPSNEMLRALGCRHVFDAARQHFTTVVDEDGRTTLEGVYAVGDCTGLSGARIALARGTTTGRAAAADLGYRGGRPDAVNAARKASARHWSFQDALWRFYAAPRLDLELATPDTVVCRCEEIMLKQAEAELDASPSIGDLKRATRAGMGACQGRYCGPILSQLLAKRQGRDLDETMHFAPRMPVKPVRIADLARS